MPSTRMTYPNGIKCPSCDTSYAMTDTLKKHMETFHPELFRNGSFVCFQCFSYFKTLSDVRIHQWAAHKNTLRETDKPSIKKHPLAGRKRSEASKAKFKATMAAKRAAKRAAKELTVRQHLHELTISTSNNGAPFQKPQLSALDLLTKFKDQRDLMITVCNMIEGVINQ